MATIGAKAALLPEGWAENVRLTVEAERIVAVERDVTDPLPARVLVPAPGNLHSHAFQRAMAGLAEAPGAGGDGFWTWRAAMYRFAEAMTPEDVEALAALVMIESAEAGFAALGEFHYLHHGAGGTPYADPAEMVGRIATASATTGLGLTLLPVLYVRAGVDGAALSGGQRRFGCDREGFARLLEASAAHVATLAPDARTGVAIHSFRAVSPEDAAWAAGLRPEDPVHLHVAEQTAEVEAVEAAHGRRPVDLALDLGANGRWCLIHATHMTTAETARLGASGAVAGLCPTTEANLGDGIFPASAYLGHGGAFGVGSDQNQRLDAGAELRLLEDAQRLLAKERCVLADGARRSTGRRLWEDACTGAARALGRGSGRIEPGALADMAALDPAHPALDGLDGDRLLDALVFAARGPGAGPIAEVWSGGRRIVVQGRHVARDAVIARARPVLHRLRGLV